MGGRPALAAVRKLVKSSNFTCIKGQASHSDCSRQAHALMGTARLAAGQARPGARAEGLCTALRAGGRMIAQGAALHGPSALAHSASMGVLRADTLQSCCTPRPEQDPPFPNKMRNNMKVRGTALQPGDDGLQPICKDRGSERHLCSMQLEALQGLHPHDALQLAEQPLVVPLVLHLRVTSATPLDHQRCWGDSTRCFHNSHACRRCPCKQQAA